MFKGRVVKSEFTDPNYKIRFSYESDEFVIQDGEAIYTRKSPLPVIVFDEYSYGILKQLPTSKYAIKKIELELGKTVIEHIIGSGKTPNTVSVSRHYTNNSVEDELLDLQKKMSDNNSSNKE